MTVRLKSANREGAAVVTPTGRLHRPTFQELRDLLAKAAADHPRAIVVDLRELEIESTTALTVFSTMHTRLAQWPGVPLLLADGSAANRTLLATARTRQYVPVHDTVAEAIAAIADPPPRRVSHTELLNDPTSPRVARRFVRDVCAEWDLPGTLAADATLVLSELVTNAVTHTTADPRVRIELRLGVLSISVTDDVPGTVAVRDPGADLSGLGGLLLVAQTSLAWGCMPTSGGGKVVWATLRAR